MAAKLPQRERPVPSRAGGSVQLARVVCGLKRKKENINEEKTQGVREKMIGISSTNHPTPHASFRNRRQRVLAFPGKQKPISASIDTHGGCRYTCATAPPPPHNSGIVDVAKGVAPSLRYGAPHRERKSSEFAPGTAPHCTALHRPPTTKEKS